MMGFFTKKEKVNPSSLKENKEETTRTDGAFVSLISHQLRTPLTTIKWYAEILLDEDGDKLTDTQKKYLKVIDDNNQRVLDLIKILSNISKLEAGTAGIDLEQVNIVDSLKDSLKKFASEISEKKIVVEEDYHSDHFVVFADKNLLNIVFNNLLSNAVRFSEEGGKIKLHTQVVKKYFEIGGRKIDKDGYVISFKNSGIGIALEDHKKIFSKMFRAENAMKAKVEGEGFGLYMVKLIIDLVGGQIWFESAINQGADFFIYLPEVGMIKHEGSKRLE